MQKCPKLESNVTLFAFHIFAFNRWHFCYHWLCDICCHEKQVDESASGLSGPTISSSDTCFMQVIWSDISREGGE
jgi:hypothetical protein